MGKYKKEDILKLFENIQWRAEFVQSLIKDGHSYFDINMEAEELKATSVRAVEMLSSLNPKASDESEVKSVDVQIIEFDAVPSGENLGAIVAFSGKIPQRGAADSYPIQLSFSKRGSFGVLNSEHFLSNADIKYHPGKTYHFKLIVYLKESKYDVWLTLDDGTRIFLANKYVFKFNTPAPEEISSISITGNSPDAIKINNFRIYEADSHTVFDTPASYNPAPVTYNVGPSREYKNLQMIANKLKPGDTVLVDGDYIYDGGIIFTQYGTTEQPITISGVKVNGKQPVIKGGRSSIHLGAANYVFEGFEIMEALNTGIRHQADNVIVRDCIIHDCPDGILSHDVCSGNITVEYCELYKNGEGLHKHQLYMATDENRYPGSVFRLQHCYIHDSTGGNTVKSRCERAEIYYNWIENSYYHALDIIGPDPEYNPTDEDLKREDCDIAGNVFISSNFSIARIGGDGTGQSNGRVRFAGNTFIFKEGSGLSAIRAMFKLESVEMYNNVFYSPNGCENMVFSAEQLKWSTGSRKVYGSYNFVRNLSDIPEEWSNTIIGDDPGFLSLEDYDLKPSDNSPLLNAGDPSVSTNSEFPIPSPLKALMYVPQRKKLALGKLLPREMGKGLMNIGAF